MPGVNFNPATDIQELSGKVILITGGTAGLGHETVVHLSKHKPAQVFFSGRNSARAASIIEEIQKEVPDAQVTFLECDLASLSSVKAASEKLLTLTDRLDILICNAGIMAKPTGLTPDGYEVQFGTNHLGHALLIQKLLPLLQHTAEGGADVRIILLSSLGFSLHPKGGIRFETIKTVQDGIAGPWVRYGQSKLANILYARELARRFPTITSLSVHPGVVNTGLVDHLGLVQKILIYGLLGIQMTEAEKGCWNTLWASTADKATVRNGQFYEPIGILSTKLDKTSKDDKLAEELWTWTEKELEPYMR